MGIMGFLRNRAGVIIVVAIGIAIVAFLLSDAIRSGQGFIADSQSEVGKVAGEAISYKDFNEKVAELKKIKRDLIFDFHLGTK